MIYRIYSDLPHFKAIVFKPGFNLLLADKSANATDKQTRNGSGKSSLLEVIHFLLGSNCDKDSIFRTPALNGAMFGMDFDVGGGSRTNVERTGSGPAKVIVAGDFSTWPAVPTKKNPATLSNEQWKTVLAKLMFGVDLVEVAWSPSFRSLISYFVRRERSGGMKDPMSQAAQQALVDQQVQISYLLGLDWHVAHAWQGVRDREKALKTLRNGLSDVLGTAATLRSQRFVEEARVERLRVTLAEFRVLEEYESLEREASQITRRLSHLSDENILDQRYLDELSASIEAEKPPEPEALEALFAEVGVTLPGLVRARFEDVAAFHESVLRNRQAYLHAERTATRERIAARNAEKLPLDARRSDLMKVLRSSGALAHFTQLQSELSKAEARLEALRQKEQMAETAEAGELRLKVERAHLVEQLRREYTEEELQIRRAVVLFQEISTRLYEAEHTGVLSIEPTENGPTFHTHIPSDKSKGVNNMRIFCFDMMLMLLSIERGRSPRVLVHDSHLFDGVDERQTGRALALGAKLAHAHNFQYIVTMNSDAVPKTLPDGFDLAPHTLDVRLTDATDDGGLFGLRFG